MSRCRLVRPMSLCRAETGAGGINLHQLQGKQGIMHLPVVLVCQPDTPCEKESIKPQDMKYVEIPGRCGIPHWSDLMTVLQYHGERSPEHHKNSPGKGSTTHNAVRSAGMKTRTLPLAARLVGSFAMAEDIPRFEHKIDVGAPFQRVGDIATFLATACQLTPHDFPSSR